MKKVANLFFVIGLMALFTSGVIAEERTEGLEIWTGMGILDSKVTFQESVPGTKVFNNEYDVSGNGYVVFGARYQFVNSSVEKLSATVEFLRASSLDGDGDYTTWTANEYVTPSNGSSSDVDAETTNYDLNLGWVLFNSANEKITINYLGGYYNSDYSFEERNYSSVSSTVVGHIADYDLEMKGMYLGVEGKFLLLADKLRLNASLKYMPTLRAEAKRRWETSSQPIVSEQDADGDGYMFNFGASFVPAQNWSIGLQFTMQELEVDGDSYRYELEFAEDDYGATTQEVKDIISAGVRDVDEISIDSFKTELRVGYIF